MSKRREKDHDHAVKLRLKGLSYSQIKEKLQVSKSTLSGWLSEYPLSDERIRQLRGNNPQRIERCRNTKAKKKQRRIDCVYEKVRKDIGILSKREIFLAGLFLYWGEGYKSAPATTGIANTDPAILRIFIRWLNAVKAPTEKIVARIHIYSDMDKNATINYWKKE
ncbi:MAG: helix-turn-helix domain-containing protein, partial [Candidatus Taylorbacteria bacterium]|nr:helix-turn-helix domain-containing protein [Candidatus Taylorbacteria bacterium]